MRRMRLARSATDTFGGCGKVRRTSPPTAEMASSFTFTPKDKVVIVQLSDWRETKVDGDARCVALKTHDQIVQRLSAAR